MAWLDDACTFAFGTVTTGAVLTFVGPLMCSDDQPLNMPSVAPTSRSSEVPVAGTNVT